VAIDEKSLDTLGRWPWPRTRIASLIDRLAAYGARVIAFDVTFSEPDESSGASVVADLSSRFEDPVVRAALENAARNADNDAKLAAALRGHPNVLLGYFFFMSAQEVRHQQALEGRQDDYHIASRFTSVRFLQQGAPEPPLPEAFAVEENIAKIAKAASHFGYFNIRPDDDGTVRWVPLAIRHHDSVYPHLAVEALRMYLGNPPLMLNAAEYGVDSIDIGSVHLPTDEQGRLLINFRGPERTFPHYSFSDVIAGTVPEEVFKDKIVLVGATAIGIYDMRVTPYSGVFPGVEIHANVIDNILRGDPISRPGWLAAVDVLAVLIMGVGLTAIISRVRPVLATFVTVVFIVSYAVANQFIFVLGKVLLSDVYPVFTVILAATGVTTYRFMTEERKKKEIKDAFQHYVSPSLVNTIVQDPAKLVLGGEERRLSVLFSDIRGFTTISEGLQPQVLVKLMNDYLTPMTEIVLATGGTVDKYMGDAIMAFWGAPVWQEDHPVRACRAALNMLVKLEELRAEWGRRGIPRLDIGIGISTGKLTVGNMGSSTRFDYTVMGDSVNLGSRLEGLNKEYGTHIIVPKYTYEDVRNDFVLRQLDLIKVKGKTIPIKIYELLGEKGSGDRLREVAGLFEAGLQAYFRRDWDKAEKNFQNVLTARADDGPTKTFLARIEHLRSADLPDAWDGVFVMTKK
jgi:adenylate cyclase